MTDVGTRLRATDGPVSGTLFGGDGERPDLPMLVCVHGGGCNAGYFDIKDHSVLQAARARGFSVLLLDRPGHGGNPALPGDRLIADAVPLIRSFIDEVRSAAAARGRGLFLIGHSIGAAVVLSLAAARGDWPLRGIAVSGLGDESPPGAWDGTGEYLPTSLAAESFLGPEGSWDWRVLPRLRRISEPWDVREIAEVRRDWPARWRQLAGRIDVPVHLRLADHEAIWVTGQAVVDRMAAALSNSPCVDAALLPEGGHLYELHKRGGELIAAQLNVAESLDGR